jgi:phage protein D/phage baseplate assembly protein gpV
MPRPTPVLTNHVVIKCGGTKLANTIADKLTTVEIESTYNRPDICLLTFAADEDPNIPAALELGKELQVSFAASEGNTSVIAFEGEVTAVEFDGSEHRSNIVVQAEDKFHRLFRNGDHTRTFVKAKASDAVSQVVREAGLTAKVTGTTAQMPFLVQQNVSDAVFILEQAAAYGFYARFQQGSLFWGEVGTGGSAGVKLRWGQNLLTFNSRATTSPKLPEVEVRSWDVLQKKEIVGTAKGWAGTIFDEKAKNHTFNGAGNGKVVLMRSEAGSQGEAKALADAALDRSNELNLQAEGRCFGDARIAVDKEIEVEGLNQRFNTKYRVSRLRHTYSHEEGFVTEFSCRGVADQSLAGLVSETAASAGAGPDRSIFDGVAIGIVTNNKDPDDMGRVKVKLPVMSQTLETDWIRVAMPGGGAQNGHHGWFLLPEVNDEVLVIFEQGDVRRGYVLGGLLNGKDKSEVKASEAIAGDGKVKQHVFRTKTGTHLLFDDTKDAEKIEIKNGKGDYTFVFDETKGVQFTQTKDGRTFTIDNKGNIAIVAQTGDISLEAKAGGITLKAMKDIVLEATGKVGVKAQQDASVEGLNVKVNAQAMAEVKAGAQATLDGGPMTIVKGGMVMIN